MGLVRIHGLDHAHKASLGFGVHSREITDAFLTYGEPKVGFLSDTIHAKSYKRRTITTTITPCSTRSCQF